MLLGFDETRRLSKTPVTNSFILYIPSLPLPNLNPSLGGHEFHIIDYVSNEDIAANPNTTCAALASGGGHFTIKNSWGAGHGDADCSYMPVDYLKANATDLPQRIAGSVLTPLLH